MSKTDGNFGGKVKPIAFGAAVALGLCAACAKVPGIPIDSSGAYLSERGAMRFAARSSMDNRSRNPEWPVESFRLNNEGFRDEDFDARGKKVFYLGDSSVFGTGVAGSETVDKRLERLFRGEGKSVQVFNLGLPGYNLESALITGAELSRRYEPDWIVCHVTVIAEDDLTYLDSSRQLWLKLRHPRLFGALRRFSGGFSYQFERRVRGLLGSRYRLETVLRHRALEAGLPGKAKLLFYVIGAEGPAQRERVAATFSRLGLTVLFEDGEWDGRCASGRCSIPGDGHPNGLRNEMRARAVFARLKTL